MWGLISEKWPNTKNTGIPGPRVLSYGQTLDFESYNGDFPQYRFNGRLERVLESAQILNGWRPGADGWLSGLTDAIDTSALGITEPRSEDPNDFRPWNSVYYITKSKYPRNISHSINEGELFKARGAAIGANTWFIHPGLTKPLRETGLLVENRNGLDFLLDRRVLWTCGAKSADNFNSASWKKLAILVSVADLRSVVMTPPLAQKTSNYTHYVADVAFEYRDRSGPSAPYVIEV